MSSSILFFLCNMSAFWQAMSSSVTSVLLCTRSYFWQCQLLLRNMSCLWRRHTVHCGLWLAALFVTVQFKLFLAAYFVLWCNMCYFWQHLLCYSVLCAISGSVITVQYEPCLAFITVQYELFWQCHLLLCTRSYFLLCHLLLCNVSWVW